MAAILDSRDRLRCERAAIAMHALGPRVLYEFVIETNTIEVLERYATLNPDTLRALGGSKFPPRIRRVA